MVCNHGGGNASTYLSGGRIKKPTFQGGSHDWRPKQCDRSNERFVHGQACKNCRRILNLRRGIGQLNDGRPKKAFTNNSVERAARAAGRRIERRSRGANPARFTRAERHGSAAFANRLKRKRLRRAPKTIMRGAAPRASGSSENRVHTQASF